MRAVDLARITGKYEEPYDYLDMSAMCWVPWCLEHAERGPHHVMTRGQMAGPFDWLEIDGQFLIGNLVGICKRHHDDIHGGRASIRLRGRAWEFTGDGRTGMLNPRAPVRTLSEGANLDTPSAPKRGASEHADPVPGMSGPALHCGGPVQEPVAPSLSVPPGQDCPTCSRRVPHPRKQSSPKSKTFGFRVPLDEVDEFSELMDAAAAHWGVKHVPHHKYRLILDALVLVLQTEKDAA